VRHASLPVVIIPTCILALLVAFAGVRLGPLWSLLAGWLAAQAAVLVLCLGAWDWQHMWLPLIPLALAATIS